MSKVICHIAAIILVLPWLGSPQADGQETNGANGEALITSSVAQLVAIQEEDGAWPYEGVYRVRGNIPVGYRIGGTAIVCESLLYSNVEDDGKTAKAIERGINLILQLLEHRLMEPSDEDRYDVRVWGHIYALDLFCRLKLADEFPELRKQTDPWIDKLVDALEFEEIDGGGWNYASQRRHASFVTAPAVQALLLARQAGHDVPEDLFERAADVLKKSRTTDGAFQYSGTSGNAALPGSIARSAVSEATLILLDDGNVEHLQAAIDAFHEHWDELEKRRKKTGTHKPPYGVAPYYFYYGHRYLAQAIAFLPEDKQQFEIERFNKVLMRTKDEDDTWNDRVFERSRNFGTAMAMLALLQHQVPLPKAVNE